MMKVHGEVEAELHTFHISTLARSLSSISSSVIFALGKEMMVFIGHEAC
jgi:hypothetical protein